MMKNDKFIYFFLNFLTFISVLLVPFFRIDGGVSDDTFMYIKIADNLPQFTSSVWPIGYPIVIRLFNFLVQDFYITTRVIAVAGVLFIMFFSYFKNFFFKETSILLALKVFTIFLFSYSETLFLPFFYVLLYLLYNFLKKDDNKLIDILKISLIITVLCVIRYASIFILGGLIFLLFLELTKKDKFTKRIIDLSSVILFSIIGFLVFLYFNYVNTGGFLGENNRNPSILQQSGIGTFIIKNLSFSFFSAMNPVMNVIRINKLLFVLSVLSSLVSFGGITYFITKAVFKKNLSDFQKLLLFIGVSVFIGLIYSSFTTGIDGLHIRLSIVIYLCIYFFILISFKDQTKLFLPLAFASLFINFLLTYNESFNYIEKRRNVKEYVLNQKELKYYYNDVNNIPTETGGTKTSNFFTIFCLNPSIKIIPINDLDKIKTNSIIRESELVEVKPINRTVLINNNTFSK